ncbi:MAG: DUF362 domain-containing protein [Myxococcales bacterium]|nr:DUF362 domain-containing protein [Myxococcales bacterium]MDH5307981.1 DUF362 domain-containing protein [Myxococcales bacterium]
MLPRMMRIGQRFAAPRLDDVAGAVARGVQALALEGRVAAGASVAVGCSSRGIANYPVLVRATVDALRRLGADPFLVPAMGSHGAASAEGQVAVLARLGVDPATAGAPVRASMDVVQIGTSADGIPVLIDKFAAEADHLVLVNRVKSHTDFTHEFESGLLKMLAIGLGKQRGAELCHREMMVRGYPRVISQVAERILATGKLLFGVGVVENAYAQTAEIGVLAPEGLAEAEAALLRRAKALAATLPVGEIDLLVIDEIGKDVSGAGFDPKVAGRPEVGEPSSGPRVKRLAVRDLSEATHGHAAGIGYADFTTRRLVEKIDRVALYTNALTASAPEEARIPLTLESDLEMIVTALGTIGPVSPERARVVRIRNTLVLDEIEVSEAYQAELASRPELEMREAPRPMFGADGALPPLPARASA